MQGRQWIASLSLIFATTIIQFARAESPDAPMNSVAQSMYPGDEIGIGFPSQVLRLWPVAGAAPGGKATLWAQVKNISSTSLPSESQVWFWVDGPGWTDSPWIGSTSVAALVPGTDNWYSYDWTIPSGANEGNYTCWAQVWTATAISDWSAGQSFGMSRGSVPGKAIQVSPAGVISATTPTYIWTAVSQATWYYLWVGDGTGAVKIQNWYTAQEAGCGSGTGNCSATPALTLNKGSYQWWVQTWNLSGYGPWSDGMSFTAGGTMVGPFNIEFVSVPAGEFQMGSTNGNSDEQPVHRVIISKPLQLGKYEITQGQWRAAMGNSPSYFKGDDNLPVEMISWDYAQTFLAKLNALNDGYSYRLPTEAEWEYACRAGTTGDFGVEGNTDDIGWTFDNALSKTHPVGTKKANAWGLFDMHGNVWEWVQDWLGTYPAGTVTDPTGASSSESKVTRGGSYGFFSIYCRSASRKGVWPFSWYGDLGLRVLRTPK